MPARLSTVGVRSLKLKVHLALGLALHDDRATRSLQVLKGACCMGRILQTLRVRYALDMIYTYSGNILIAVHPLSSSPHQMLFLPLTSSPLSGQCVQFDFAFGPFLLLLSSPIPQHLWI